MAVKVTPTSVLFGIATVILITLTTTAGGEGLPRDCMLNQVKANSKNPHTFYWCLPDGPVLFHCIDDLVFDTKAKKCITQKQQQLKSRDKRGSKVTVTPILAAQTQKDKKPNTQAQPDKKPTPQAKPEMSPNAQAQPNKKPTPQAKPDKNPSAQAQPEKKPTAQAQPEQKPSAPESQDKKSTSPYYYSTLYPFPSRYIPSQPSVPAAASQSSAPFTPTASQSSLPLTPAATQPFAPMTAAASQQSAPLTPASSQPFAPLISASYQPSAPLTSAASQQYEPLPQASYQPSAPLTQASYQPSAPLTQASYQPSTPLTQASYQPSAPLTSAASQPFVPMISAAPQTSTPMTAVVSQTASTDSAEFIPDCPIPQYGRDAPLILIPSQDYCDEFFFCSNGKSYRFTCPEDTDFNSELRVCDHVRNMKCASGKRRRDIVKQDESPVPRVAPSSSQISTPSSP